ncbi:MAG: hypothetical protein JRN08_03500 [Nitrososphaerota archaeon]|nr:hypothetical protein [Nitrososphaerota archaeon]
MNLKVELGAAVAGLLLVGAFFLAPMVPYSLSFAIPGNDRIKVAPCSTPAGNVTLVQAGGGGNATFTIVCLGDGPYPPATVAGRSTLSYYLLGSGPPPFPSQAEITQGNLSALIFFQGDQAVAAETIGPAGTTIDPPVQIVRSSLSPAPFGQENFTAVIRNEGDSSVSSPVVYLRTEGYGFNQTVDGLLWSSGYPLGFCGRSTPHVLLPGSECKTSVLVTLPTNATLTYQVEVRGEMDGHGIFYSQDFRQFVPSEAVTPSWVAEFIQDVDGARGPVPLAETPTLDQFAALRFKTASAQPDVSDYGFARDLGAFFTSGGPASASETLLFPAGFTPANYTSFLRTSAPGHWGALTNETYGHYGYYIGSAPYYAIPAGCPVTEVPSAGVNITQFFASHGCTLATLPDTSWLVIVLTA